MSTPHRDERSAAVRLYGRVAARLLPSDLRDDYGQMMVDVFAELHRDARRRGRYAALATLARELIGLARVACHERLGGRHDRRAARRRLAAMTLEQHLFTGGNARRPVPNTRERGIMENLVKDIKFGCKMLLRYRGVTVAAVLSLALGIGANTAIYTTIQGVFFPPLPVDDAERLVSLFVEDPRNPGYLPISHPNYLDFRDRNRVFSGLASMRQVPLSLRAADQEGEQVASAMVSGNFFEVVGVEAAAGRLFDPAEAEVQGAYPVAVLSHGFWQRHFGGDPQVVGSTVFVNRAPFTVIGVSEAHFDGLAVGLSPDLYVPDAMYEQLLTDTSWHTMRRALAYSAVGRLRPGVTLEQASEELDAIAAQLAEEFPNDNAERGVSLVPTLEARVNPNLRDVFVQSFGMMSAVVGLVLLIACANVANLLLSRAAGRRREVAVRLALGARRGRLIRQMLTESVLLAAAGGMLGLLVAGWTTNLLYGSLPRTAFPLRLDLSLDAGVLLFTVALSLLTGVVFGLAPAVRATRPQVVPALKGEASQKPRERRVGLRNGLVVAQVALSLMLLIAAGLFVRSMQNAQGIDPGFRIDNALVYTLDVGLEGYAPEQGLQFFDQLGERTAALPGVTAVAVSDRLPMGFGGFRMTTFAEDQDRTAEEAGRLVDTASVGTGYFEALGQRVLEGRDFTRADREGAPRVAIVNEPMAEQFWPGDRAVGKRIYYINQEDRPLEVVGVASYAKVNSLGEEPTPMIYMPITQQYAAGVQLIVRSDAPADTLAPAIRSEIRTLDARMPVLQVLTLQDVLDFSLWPARTAATLLGAFGVLGLALAAVGLSGVIANAVARRTREIGVRVALGAEPGSVLRLIMTQGFGLIMVGALIGIAMAAALSSLLASLLYGVGTTDLLAFGAGTGVLVAVAMVAAYLPARRAARIDPVVALRAE